MYRNEHNGGGRRESGSPKRTTSRNPYVTSISSARYATQVKEGAPSVFGDVVSTDTDHVGDPPFTLPYPTQDSSVILHSDQHFGESEKLRMSPAQRHDKTHHINRRSSGYPEHHDVLRHNQPPLNHASLDANHLQGALIKTNLSP